MVFHSYVRLPKGTHYIYHGNPVTPPLAWDVTTIESWQFTDTTSELWKNPWILWKNVVPDSWKLTMDVATSLICWGWSIRGRKMDGNLWFYVKCTWLVSLVNNGIQPLISVFMGKVYVLPKTNMHELYHQWCAHQETHLRKQDLTSIPASVL